MRQFKLAPWWGWLIGATVYAISIVSFTSLFNNIIKVPHLHMYMQIGIFFPEIVPYSLFGPVGRLAYYINYSHQWLLVVALGTMMAAHFGEALYAYILARSVAEMTPCNHAHIHLGNCHVAMLEEHS